MDLLAIPRVDKTIAIVACLPFAFELYRRWAVGHVNFPRAVLGLQLLIIIVLMVLRTAPVRVNLLVPLTTVRLAKPSPFVDGRQTRS